MKNFVKECKWILLKYAHCHSLLEEIGWLSLTKLFNDTKISDLFFISFFFNNARTLLGNNQCDAFI